MPMKPPDVAEPLMEAVAAADRRPPAKPGQSAQGDRFVTDVRAAKAAMNARVAAQSRRENAWRK
jgi:hypothetical protein